MTSCPERDLLPVDSHTHTYLCRHARGTPLDYARAALDAGLAGIVCTDHLPFPDEPEPTIRMRADEFPRYLELVDEARAAMPPGFVGLGLEADFHTPLVPDWLRRHFDAAPFDLVLGSVHTGPYWDMTPDDPAVTPEVVREVFRRYFLKMERLARSRIFDACAHFDLPKRRGFRVPEDALREMVLPALDAVAEAGMAVEINTSGAFHGIRELYPSAEILSWMHERGIGLLFGSDAHLPARVGSCFAEAVALARAAGYTRYRRYAARRFREVPLPAP